MTLKAIVVMTIIVGGVWGGLIYSMVRLQKMSGKELTGEER